MNQVHLLGFGFPTDTFVTFLVLASIIIPSYLLHHYDIYGSMNPADTIHASGVTPNDHTAAFAQVWVQALPFIVAAYGYYVRRHPSKFYSVSTKNLVYLLAVVSWFVTVVLRPASGGSLVNPTNNGVESVYKYVGGAVAAGSLFAVPAVYFM